MTLSVSIVALFLGLFGPAKTADQTPEQTPDQTVEQTVEQVAAQPLCSLAMAPDNRRLLAAITAPARGFEGSARLQLAGTRCAQDDTRPVLLQANESVSPWARVSVPLPADLQGSLTILNASGEAVCTARL